MTLAGRNYPQIFSELIPGSCIVANQDKRVYGVVKGGFAEWTVSGDGEIWTWRKTGEKIL